MNTEIEIPGEQGEAEKFVKWYGRNFRYSPPWKKYLAWDGKRWSLESGTVIVRGLWQRYFKEKLKFIADNTDPSKMAEALDAQLLKATVKYENAMITLCQARTMFDYRTLDANPWILNVDNGILDLKTGVLYQHTPEVMCTHLAPVAWDPNAPQCPKWIEYLNWCMQGDAEQVAYLQKFFGLCLTGDAEHELAHFFWGG